MVADVYTTGGEGGQSLPESRQALLDLMLLERARWEVLLSQVAPARLEARIAHHAGSVGGMVSRLLALEQEVLGWLEGSLTENSGKTAGDLSPRVQYLHLLAPTVAICSTAPRAETVCDRSRGAFEAIVRRLLSASHADLFEQGRWAWAHGGSVADVVAERTYTYYRLHDPVIRRWLGPKRSRRRATV